MGRAGQDHDPAGEACPAGPGFSEQECKEDTGEECRSDMSVV